MLSVWLFIRGGDKKNYAVESEYIEKIYSGTKLNEGALGKKNECIRSKVDYESYKYIERRLDDNLSSSLRVFSSQDNVWLEPKLYTEPESSQPSKSNTAVRVEDIIDRPRSIIIRARQQYGLTCLSKFLVKEAWTKDHSSCWLYLDAEELKPYRQEIEKYVNEKLEKIGLKHDDIEGVVLDEFSSSLKKYDKLISVVSDFFKGTPLIVMETISDNPPCREECLVLY